MIKPISILALGTLLVLPGLAVQAASECKGLDQTACGVNPGCSWVSGYTRKDGKEVAAYCKSKGEKQTGEAAGGAQQAGFNLMQSFLNLMLDPTLTGRNEAGARS